ncbi:TPA: hypothetical protein NV714_001663 [Escherichia coli]|nr:hypothetical protein [Escherichia coli]
MNKTLTPKFKTDETQRLLSYQLVENEDLEQVILNSLYYRNAPVDCFQNLLYGFIHRPKIKETEDTFFSFFVSHIKEDQYFQIFQNIPTFASKFIDQYKSSAYSNEEFISILKGKKYFDPFDFFQVMEQKTPNEFKKLYYNSFTKNDIKTSIFNIIAYPFKHEYSMDFINYCIDKNYIEKEDLIRFAINPLNEINGHNRFYILYKQSDYEFRLTHVNELVNLIKDDIDLVKNIPIEFYAELYKDNTTLWLIYAGLKLYFSYDFNFNEFLYKQNEKETLSLIKDFKNNYPNLYESLYINSASKLSDDFKSKSILQKIILSLDMQENGLQNNVIKKRL